MRYSEILCIVISLLNIEMAQAYTCDLRSLLFLTLSRSVLLYRFGRCDDDDDEIVQTIDDHYVIPRPDLHESTIHYISYM